MTALTQGFVAVLMFCTAAVSIAEVPALSPQVLEAMPFNFRGTVYSIESKAASSDQCRIEKKFDVSLEKVESLRDSRILKVAKLEGSGFEFQNGCVGGSGARILGYIEIGEEIVVHADAPDASGIFHIYHNSQIDRNPK